MTRTCSLILAGAALVLTGCGGRVTDVSGSVSYQGKPIVFGSVVIVGADGMPRSGTIQPDGSFTVSGVAIGPAKVAVSSPRPPGLAKPPAPKRGGRDEGMDERRPADAGMPVDPAIAKGWFPLPDDFGNPETSGIAIDIAPGKSLVLELK